jgi:hypothetical protein
VWSQIRQAEIDGSCRAAPLPDDILAGPIAQSKRCLRSKRILDVAKEQQIRLAKRKRRRWSVGLVANSAGQGSLPIGYLSRHLADKILYSQLAIMLGRAGNYLIQAASWR